MDGRISLGRWLVVGWLYRTNMYIESYIIVWFEYWLLISLVNEYYVNMTALAIS